MSWPTERMDRAGHLGIALHQEHVLRFRQPIPYRCVNLIQLLLGCVDSIHRALIDFINGCVQPVGRFHILLIEVNRGRIGWWGGN